MSTKEHNIFSIAFIVVFAIAISLLMFLLIRKLYRDRKYGMFFEEKLGGFSTQKLCALVIMLPAFFEFLINSYYHVYLQKEEANFWFSIIDILFLICSMLVYRNISIKWMVLIMNVVQVYTFAPSIIRHINEEISPSIIRFIISFIYYVIVTCVLIRIMYPGMFVRKNKVARL